MRISRQENKAYKQGARKLTQGFGISILDHLTKRNLGRRKNSIPVPLHFPQLFFFLQFLAQPLLGIGLLFLGLFNLGLTSSNSFLQRPGMSQPGLDQLLL